MSPLDAAKGRGPPAQSIRVYSEYPISFGFNGKTSGSGICQVGHRRSHFFTPQSEHKSFAEDLGITETHNCVKFAIQNWSYLLGEVEHRWQVHFLLLSYARKLFCCFKANFSGPFHGQKLCHSETKCHLARSVVSFTNRSWKPGSYDYQVHTCHLIMHQSRLAIANFTRRVPQRVSVCGLESLVNWKLVAALWCAASHQPAQAFPFNFLLLVPTQFSHPKLLLILSK